MTRVLLFDFSRTLIFPKDPSYDGKLNDLYRQIISNKNYDIFEHFVLNEELINFVKSFKSKYNLVIFTTDILQNDPAIKHILDRVFSKVYAAKDLEVSKREPNGYKTVAEKLNVHPKDILFIDDLEDNINPAKEAGLQTIRYISNNQLIEELRIRLTPTP